MRKKLLLILFILLILLTSLTGCYDARGSEDRAYAIALGLDISNDDLLLLTLQFSIPDSGSNSSGSSQSNTTDSITVKCNSINSGLSLIDSYINKEVDLSHCKAIIISEELASKGLSEYIDTFANNIEVRPDCNLIISKCPASIFIQNATPFVETLTARYYQVALSSSEYTGYTTSTKLADFISSFQTKFIQPYAILGGLNTGNTLNFNYNYKNTFNNESDGNYVAGQSPILDKERVEIFGTAIFQDGKLVGELNGIETICHLLVTNELKNCTLSIPNPSVQGSNIDLSINMKNKTKINVDFINGSPFISINVYLDGYGLSLDENTDYSSLKDIELINSYAEDYVKVELENYLYKLSKEYNADVVGFGKYALYYYPTWNEWISSDWLENFKNSFFKVNVSVNIKSGYQFNNSP